MKRKLWIAALVIVIDQISKALVRGMTDTRVLIPGILGLCHA